MGYLPDGMPLPDTEETDTREWWAACKERQLVLQRCKRCGTFRHPPVPVCYNCHSFEYEWHPVKGKGIVHSYIIPYYPAHLLLREKEVRSYNVVLVELPEAGGVRMIGNLIDCRDEELRVGMLVELTWEEKEGVLLPQWRRAQT